LVPLFAATAQNLRSENENIALLQRYENLNDTGAFTQRFERFANDRAEHATPVGALHRVAWSGRGHKKVACDDRPVFSVGRT
jgi:hypothetical protein